MKFTLKDYQDDAVRDVLDRLRKARKRWHEDGDCHAFSLTAATGAGKTVMAAAAFEALFHSDNERDFEGDPGAVVIWFSDDPSLNEQTRYRLMQAADRINLADMVVVENTFQREKLQAGKIYFLNTQKLGKKSLLVRGFDPEGQFEELRPDLRSYTIWDTIRNTIEDPDLTLYLVLDEAHRGMGGTESERPTIVKRLINGYGDVPPIPVVWGISATVDRFNKAMEGAKDRATLSNVIVDSAKVQESGLLKDTIVLDVPDEDGAFETVLVRRGTVKLRELDKAWTEYAKEQGGEAVAPLMVLQVPNKPDEKQVSEWIETILSAWPELTPDNFANVFGEHKAETFGSYMVPYVAPQDVQERDWVRVLIAKDAISTGWDCPRAEVMVSLRAATDRTHIMQLLGRMVRTPLARRVPGNERLNSVDCLLPYFNRESVEAVANALMQGGTEGDGGIPGRRVLINPKDMRPNPAVPSEVWEKFVTLPSQSLPQRTSKPVARLTALAHELARDKLLPNAGKLAHAEMHNALDAAANASAAKVAEKRKETLAVEGAALRLSLADGGTSFDSFVEAADLAVIEAAYKQAARQFSPDVTRTYAEYLADQEERDDDEEALIEAHTAIAALGLVGDVKIALDNAATKLTDDWFAEYRDAIRGLSDERQDDYRQIKSMSNEPQDVDLTPPTSRLERTEILEADRTKKSIPTFDNHLICGEDGKFPAELNTWETKVLKVEMAREGFVAWYRNPDRPSQDSLGISYKDGKVFSIVRPDYLFFAKMVDGSIVADLVDPHGTHLADALPKLKGLASYAEKHGGNFRRIEAIAETGNGLRKLDLINPDVRSAIDAATDAKSLYEGPASTDY